MTPSRSSLWSQNARDRRGAALVAALVCVLLVSLMSAVLVKTALVQRDQLERDAWQVQADWLAQSALERSLVRLESETAYAGEVWTPLNTDGKPIGRVAIEIVQTVNGDVSARLLRATADVPDDPVNRVRSVHEWKLAGVKPSVNTSD